VTEIGAAWRSVGEGTAVRVQHLQDDHRSRHKGKLRYDETFRRIWGKGPVMLVGRRTGVERFRSQFLMKYPVRGALYN